MLRSLTRSRRRQARGLAAGLLLTAAVTAAATLTATPVLAAQAAPAKNAHRAAQPVRSLTAAQAMRRAQATGKPVLVTGATTATSTLTANPNGTMTVTQHSVPVRVLQSGRWVAVNATLQREADGGIHPSAADGYLRLSSGGTGPLVTIGSGLHTLTETLAGARIPAPALAGPTATYADVLPGVDLKITADTMGGYTDVLIVKNAAAARNPALRHLHFTMTAPGLRMHAGPGGALSFTTGTGQAVFTGPAPRMWDSRTAASTVHTALSPVTGRVTDLRNGQPAASDAAGPGEAARTAPVTVQVTGSTVTYAPSISLLTGARTRFPLYVDPAAGSTLQGWWQVDTINTGELFPKPSLMQVGYDGPDWTSSTFTARSFVQMSWPSIMRGSGVHIYSSTLYLQDYWAPSCIDGTHDFGVQVWRTGPVTGSTSWSSQPAWSSEQQEKSFAYGYDTKTCAEGTAGFNTLEAAQTAATGSYPNITFGIKADSETDEYGWKQFTHNVTMTTTYDWPPNVTSPSTSPATTCGQDDSVGLGDVMLYVKVSSPEGTAAGGLYPTIKVLKTSTGATIATYADTTSGYASGSTYAVRVPQATLTSAAGGTATELTWTASVTDNTLTSTTITCHLTYDPTRPGPPTVTNCPTQTNTGISIGTKTTFTIAPNSTGTTPTGYHTQLNAAAPVEAKMTDTSGDGQITVIPTRGANALTVTPYSSAGNIGESYTCVFSATTAAPAADGDMTGDGIADLLTAGGPNTGMPSGLWQAAGETDAAGTGGNTQVVASPIDIGIEGNGIANDYTPADFDGADVITGRFYGDGLQDTLNFYPASGNTSLLYGNGDGSVLESEDASNTEELDNTTLVGDDNVQPKQVVNAYNAYNADNSGYPDLLTRSTGNLFYFQNGSTGGYWWNDFPLVQSTSCTPACPIQTPDQNTDWANWQIATMDDPTASGHANVFLYNKTNGELWLWQNFVVTQPQDDPTVGTAGYTPYELSSSWNPPGAVATLRAGDITGNAPGLWTVTTSGTVTSWTLTWLNGQPSIISDATQNLLPPAHDWRLGDGISGQGQASTATDTGGAATKQNLTGNSGTTWSGSDLFYPAVQFNGTSGYMHTSAQVIDPTNDWTVSAWVKPDTLGGIVLSEYGTNASCMRISINGSIWRLATTSANTTTATSATVDATTVPVQLGTWTHLTATYNAAGNYMELYVNGVPSAGGSAGTTWASGCSTFALSQWVTGGTAGGFINGKIADVQTWNTTLSPLQVASMSMTPGYLLFPNDGHHYPSGSTWTTLGGTMTFTNGVLTVNGNKTKTYNSGNPSNSSSAYLTLQGDGNLVIYTGTGSNGAMWASGTSGHPGDLMFFQPDGNLVIYNDYGQTLWASGTA